MWYVDLIVGEGGGGLLRWNSLPAIQKIARVDNLNWLARQHFDAMVAQNSPLYMKLKIMCIDIFIHVCIIIGSTEFIFSLTDHILESVL